MTIYPTYPEDIGDYACVLTNNLGSTECHANLTAVVPETLQLHSMHESALQQINDIESFQVHIGPIPVDRPEEFVSIETPKLVRPLGGKQEVNQDDPVHFVIFIIKRAVLIFDFRKLVSCQLTDILKLNGSKVKNYEILN